MSGDLSFLRLILEASIIVQLVMLMLAAASIASWAVILKKRRVLNHATSLADSFEQQFWSGGDLTAMYQTISKRKQPATGMESIFEGGFREFMRLRSEPEIDQAKMMESSQRAMRVSQMREVDRLERNLAMLATIGSTSPYVGLFGTVWGIMNSFSQLGNVKHATLAMVAPGIAEALVATAMGLFAAIPAVIAYNRYADQVTRLENRYDTFAEEFVSILQRHTPRSKPGS
ncbi:MAG: protein TolQ [Gammaproteobacteria bacterium]|nr:protein TolQ [Gammaproteobacteria bacterium]